MKILLAVDGSKHSLSAVDCLLQHANWYRTRPEVELVTVLLPVPKVGSVLGSVVTRSMLKKFYDEEGAANLAAARKKLDKARVKYAAHVLVGPIAETLIGHAKRSGCDLIHIGTRGMSATANMVLGSTATKVLHLSPIPVLLVK